MSIIFVYVVYIILLLVNSNNSEEIVSDIEIPLYHSYDGILFKQRGNLLYQIKSNKISINNQNYNNIPEEDTNEFKLLLQTNGFYQIRVNSQLGNNSSNYVLSSIPACELQKSGFKEDITIHLDDSEKFIIGLSYSSPMMAMARPCNPNKVQSPQVIHTKLKIGEKTAAQLIPLNVLGPRPPQLKNVNFDTTDENPNDNQKQVETQNVSFLRRYWYIVVALIIYVLIPQPPETKQSTSAAEKKTQ